LEGGELGKNNAVATQIKKFPVTTVLAAQRGRAGEEGKM